MDILSVKDIPILIRVVLASTTSTTSRQSKQLCRECHGARVAE